MSWLLVCKQFRDKIRIKCSLYFHLYCKLRCCWRCLHHWQKFYTATGSDGMNISHLWTHWSWSQIQNVCLELLFSSFRAAIDSHDPKSERSLNRLETWQLAGCWSQKEPHSSSAERGWGWSGSLTYKKCCWYLIDGLIGFKIFCTIWNICKSTKKINLLF